MESMPEDHQNSDQVSKKEENYAAEADVEDEDGYRTPTSEEHRIPVRRSPPPAPKRKRLPFDRTDYIKRVKTGKSIAPDTEIEAFFKEMEAFYRSFKVAPSPPDTDTEESTDRIETF